LTGGFFLNNKMAGAKEVAAVAAKMKAGQSLTVAETKLAQAAQPAISAAIARMETAGGVRTGRGAAAESLAMVLTTMTT
jgi:hypothetical protein